MYSRKCECFSTRPKCHHWENPDCNSNNRATPAVLSPVIIKGPLFYVIRKKVGSRKGEREREREKLSSVHREMPAHSAWVTFTVSIMEKKKKLVCSAMLTFKAFLLIFGSTIRNRSSSSSWVILKFIKFYMSDAPYYYVFERVANDDDSV